MAQTKRGYRWRGLNQRHEDPQLQAQWTLTQASLLLLPLSSLLGSVGLAVVMLALCFERWRLLSQRIFNRGFAVLGVLMLMCAALALKPADASLGLFNFLPFFLFFAAMSELIQTPAHLRRLAWVLVLGSLPVVAIGLGQFFLHWGTQLQLYVLTWDIAPNGTPPGRMSSVFFYANVLASYLVITFILSVGLWLEAWDDRQTRSYHLRQLLLTGAVLGNAMALILTDSRNAWAIAVLACLAFAVYRGWHGWVAGVATITASVLWAAFGVPPSRDWLRAIVPAFFWVRLTDQMYPDRPVEQLRSTQWKFALSLAAERPGTGWGLRSFSDLYAEKTQLVLGHPHNLLFMLMAETGIPATLLLVTLVGAIVLRGVYWLRVYWLQSWQHTPNDQSSSAALLVFTYLTAFLGCTLFSFLDITLFDVRLNILGWLLLAAIAGITLHSNRLTQLQ